jgi:hypothetical protein
MHHVERGVANRTSVTIASIGTTFHNAIRAVAVVDARAVNRQLRLAGDALQRLDVAHYDVCTENMFVLDDGTIMLGDLLGDLEYCTECDSPPPQAR